MDTLVLFNRALEMSLPNNEHNSLDVNKEIKNK